MTTICSSRSHLCQCDGNNGLPDFFLGFEDSLNDIVSDYA